MKVRLKSAKRTFLGEGVDNGIEPRDIAYIRSYAIKFAKNEERHLNAHGKTLASRDPVQEAKLLAGVCFEMWEGSLPDPSTSLPKVLPHTPSGKNYLDKYKVLIKMFEMYIKEYIYSIRD